MTAMGDVIEFVPRFSLTDRQRELLRVHAWVCADMAYDDIEERGDDPVDTGRWWYLLDRLPECTYTESAPWRRRMARSFDDLAEGLDTGRLPRPRTMAEQLALVIVIAQASAALTDEGYGDEIAAPASHPRDGDWDAVSDGLMADRDVEVFYSPGDSSTRSAGAPVRYVVHRHERKRATRPSTRIPALEACPEFGAKNPLGPHLFCADLQNESTPPDHRYTSAASSRLDARRSTS